MSEEEIAQRLKQTIPKGDGSSALPAVAPVLVDEQSSIVENAVNELSLLKLANHLGLAYMPTNQETIDRLKFIYEQAADLSPNSKQESIMATIEDLLLRLGYSFEPDRFMKLYLWLKLNQERAVIENEMANI